jgi:hypothetical protein
MQLSLHPLFETQSADGSKQDIDCPEQSLPS